MNKKLIAVALAALPVAAMADVTLYGKMAVGVENVKEGDASSKTNIDSLGSRIGFKGSEDLGNGLKAIWQVEQKVVIDGSGAASDNSFATRDSFLGFQGNFGKVRLGRLSNYQNSDMEDVDPWEYGSSALGLGTFTRNDGRIKNAVRYDSPALAGFNATVVYGADEKAGVNNDNWNVGLGYSLDAFFAKYSYLRKNDVSGDKSDQSHRVEAGYSANNLLVAVGYQQTKSQVTGTGTTTDPYASNFAFNIGSAVAGDEVKDREAVLTVAYTMGALTPKLSLAKGWDVKVDGDKESDTGYKQYVVGVDYALSKRTVLGAQVGKLDFDGGKDKDIRAVGVNAVHKF